MADAATQARLDSLLRAVRERAALRKAMSDRPRQQPAPAPAMGDVPAPRPPLNSNQTQFRIEIEPNSKSNQIRIEIEPPKAGDVQSNQIEPNSDRTHQSNSLSNKIVFPASSFLHAAVPFSVPPRSACLTWAAF